MTLARGTTQRVMHDIKSLESIGYNLDDDDNKDDDKMLAGGGNRENVYFLDDILNAKAKMAVDTELEIIQEAFDECLHYISIEWRTATDMLTKTVSDVSELLNLECPDAYHLLNSSIMDNEKYLNSMLLKISRKMFSIKLTQSAQKMVFIPHDFAELEEILAQMSGIQTLRAAKIDDMHMGDGNNSDGTDNDMEDDDIKEDDAQPELIPATNLQNVSSGARIMDNATLMQSLTQKLTQLVLTNSELYKDSSICKTRELTFSQSGGGRFLKIASKSKSKSNDQSKATQPAVQTQTELAKLKSTSASLTSAAAESAIDNEKLSRRDGAHPTVSCEGCQNEMDLDDFLESAILYRVQAMPKKLVYFHDELCVSLRRMKESVRKYVMQSNLHPAKHSRTTIGYVKNLVQNYKSLITTLGTVPQPINIYAMNKKQSKALASMGSGQRKSSKYQGKSADDHEEQYSAEQQLFIARHRMSRDRVHAMALIKRRNMIDTREPQGLDDEYQWKFADLAQMVLFANMTAFGESFWKYLVFQLLSKQTDTLWLLLAYTSGEISAVKALSLLDEYRADLSKVKEMDNLDLVCISMIESSNYTIAMALYLSAFMAENGEADLSRQEDFEEVSVKYIRIASTLVSTMESDHLLSLLLEIPTDLANQSVWDIALANQITDFTDSSRIQLLGTHMWSEFDYLNPNENFRTKDIELFELISFLAKTPAKFYYCPVGRYWLTSLMYFGYVLIVTSVSLQGNYSLASRFSNAEITMWVFTAGFVVSEITQMAFTGWAYLQESGNMFDMLIIIDWLLLAILRWDCRAVMTEKQCTGNHDSMPVLIYMFVFCTQLCVLWSRLALIFTRHKTLGPFIAMLPGMITDVINWAFVLAIFYAGFSFGMWFLIAGDINDGDCAADGNLDSIGLMYEYNFYLLMGQSEWSAINANDCISAHRAILIKVFAWIFAMIGTTLLLNLLIAMMASTYEHKREGTSKEVNFARSEMTYELSNRDAIIPPPLNVLAMVLSVLWFVCEILVYLCSGGRYVLNMNCLVPVYVSYHELADDTHAPNNNSKGDDDNNGGGGGGNDDEDDDNKRGKTSTVADATHADAVATDERNSRRKCGGVFVRIRDPKKHWTRLTTNWKSTCRYCKFCRTYMKQNGNIAEYFEQFRNYRLDESDVDFMTSLMENAGVCPNCYRPFTINEDGTTSRLYRWQVILEILSFYVFCVFCYLPLLLLMSLPAAYSGLLMILDGVVNQTNIDDNQPKKQFADEKYLELVEQTITGESNTDTEEIGEHIAVLNTKLMQVRSNQHSTNNVLVEMNQTLQNSFKILNQSLVPYIHTIDRKVDIQAKHSTMLHTRSLAMLEEKFDATSQAILQSKNILDEQTGMSKSHQTELDAQMQFAKKQEQSMMEFKEQLSELKDLRSQDEKVKREQEERQLKLEAESRDNMLKFQSELKQQRVMREIEMKKAQKNNQIEQASIAQQHAENLAVMQGQLEEQQLLRQIELQKVEDEKHRRELLGVQQQQDMAVIQSQLQQLHILREAESSKRTAELEFRRKQDEKMMQMEAEMQQISQLKQSSRKRDSMAVAQDGRLQELGQRLMEMQTIREDEQRLHTEEKELQELQEHDMKNKEMELQEKMETLQQSQEENVVEQQKIEAHVQEKQQQFVIAVAEIQKSFSLMSERQDEYEYDGGADADVDADADADADADDGADADATAPVARTIDMSMSAIAQAFNNNSNNNNNNEVVLEEEININLLDIHNSDNNANGNALNEAALNEAALNEAENENGNVMDNGNYDGNANDNGADNNENNNNGNAVVNEQQPLNLMDDVFGSGED